MNKWDIRSGMLMKWKLILSFSAISLFFLVSVLYQNVQLDNVGKSMTQQKLEMEKRLVTGKITQLLQELNGIENSLKLTSETDLAKSFKSLEETLQQELGQLSFEPESKAETDLKDLVGKVEQYDQDFTQMVDALNDESLDPLVVIEKMDELHTKAITENKDMLEITEPS